MAAVRPLYESVECCTRALPSPGGGLTLPGLLPVEGVGPLVCEEIPSNVLVMFCSVIFVDLGRAG